ncbi:MAG: hypothetical protein IJ874_06635 [Ruminococcus sp.]|nr:hypothetical protein [Ruminococcus sp.]
MKKEDLYELMGDIDENAVADAEKPPARSRHRWINHAAAAAVFIAAFAGGVFFMAHFDRSNDKKYDDVATIPETADNAGFGYGIQNAVLAAAQYPEMPEYPDETKYPYGKGHEEAYSEWASFKRELREQPPGYKDGYDTFFTSSVRTFLNGTGSGNMIYSPVSLYMALGMSAEITDGNTRQQILDVLAQDDIDTLRQHFKSIWLANYNNDGMGSLVLADSLWLSNHYSYNKNTADLLADNYYSSVYSGDPGTEEYNSLMHDWLNKQTDGLLSDHVSGIEMPPDMFVMLASTVNYSGKWGQQFNYNNTAPGTFHSPDADVQCDFMHDTKYDGLECGENFISIDLGLAGNGKMRLILPDEGITPEELLGDDSVMKFMLGNTNYVTTKDVEVKLTVPKFDVSSSIDMIDGLQELGITDLFSSESSDFSPLSDSAAGVSVSKVEQDTRVTIDEEGCRASAFTVMVAMGGWLPDETAELTIDRPFIFEIISETGLPVFVGIVNDPTR